MTSSRSRPVFSILSVISLLLSAYLCWRLSAGVIKSSPFHISTIGAVIISFNIAIFSAWVGFGVVGGAIVSASVLLFVLLLNFRMNHYGAGILVTTYAVTALIGYLFTRSNARSGQLHLLKLERVEEEINIFSNEVKEKNKGIKVLEAKLAKYSALKDVAEGLSSVLSIEGVTGSIIDKTRKILGDGGRILLFLVSPDREELMLSASSAKNHQAIKAKKGDVFDNWTFRNRKPLLIDDSAKDFRFPASGIEEAYGVFRSLIEVPIVSDNKVIGVLRADNPRESVYSQDDLRLLDIIANLSAVAVQNSLLYLRTEELAIRDGLTGLKVRRFFMESFHREVKRASRKREQLSLLLLDIDHFKDYNDRYGHVSGDLILKYISKVIHDLLEGPDVAGRYGGEELAILLWGKGKKEAAQRAEKIRQLVKEKPLMLKKLETNITVSIGVSTFPEDAITEEELIRIADARLYRAKAEGRDRVCST